MNRKSDGSTSNVVGMSGMMMDLVPTNEEFEVRATPLR
jgi:hypothetical protein